MEYIIDIPANLSDEILSLLSTKGINIEKYSERKKKSMQETLKVFESIKAGMEEVRKIERGGLKGQAMEDLFEELEK
jgi:hypothetical protein